MAKGYWIANVDVRNPDGYKEYVAALPDIFRKFGGRYTTRGGRTEVVEGKSRSRIVIIEFPEREKAEAFLSDPEIQDLFKVRHDTTTSKLVLADGCT